MANPSLAAQIEQLQQAMLALTAQQDAVTFRPAAWQALACIPGQESQLAALCERLDPSSDDTAPGADGAIVYRITRDPPLVVDFDAGLVATEEGRMLGTIDELVAEWPGLRWGDRWRQ
jgi:hypothetical protein